ncbi:MAG: hypothetical protein IJQ20_04935 [Paludibacteraceae bacterium]|nr:hypothetical protein [Paludibacteraceae bacterium]
MKTLRYLLSMIALVSVLSLSAQTPNYGKPYKGQETQFVYTTAQMPAATMGSMDAEYMHSGSNLPMAAESGVTTTLDEQASERTNLSRPRKERPGDWTDPYPLGDVMWPMMMLALAFAFGKWIAKRTKPLR